MYRDAPTSHLPDPELQPGFYASVPIKRLIAWVFDAVLIFLLTFVVMIPIGIVTLGFGFALWGIVWITLGFLYRWATISGNSATWGMRMMAIELRDAHGQRLDGGLAFIHTLGYSLSMAFFLVQIVSIVLMAGSSRGQGVTDMALGTVMLNKRA